MAKVGCIVLADNIYGIIRNRYSLIELLRKENPDVFFRHIVSKNISSLSVIYVQKLENLRSFVKSNDKTIAFIAVGLSECSSGYNYEMMNVHVKGMISELEAIGCDVCIVNAKIKNKLNGKFANFYENNYRNLFKISEEKFCDIIVPECKLLFLEHKDYLISSHTVPSYVKRLCSYIKENKNV